MIGRFQDFPHRMHKGQSSKSSWTLKPGFRELSRLRGSNSTTDRRALFHSTTMWTISTTRSTSRRSLLASDRLGGSGKTPTSARRRQQPPICPRWPGTAPDLLIEKASSWLAWVLLEVPDQLSLSLPKGAGGTENYSGQKQADEHGIPKAFVQS